LRAARSRRRHFRQIGHSTALPRNRAPHVRHTIST